MNKFLVFLFVFLMLGCVEKSVQVPELTTPDEKALFALIEKRCEAINKRDLNLFKEIYVKNAQELEWIEKTGIPLWNRNSATFSVGSLRKITVIGNEAAVNVILKGRGNSFFTRNQEVLFVREQGKWMIEAAGDR